MKKINYNNQVYIKFIVLIVIIVIWAKQDDVSSFTLTI